MSQLSRLIKETRTSRRVVDIFNIQPSAPIARADDSQRDPLLARLAELEQQLLQTSTPLPVDDLLQELNSIAQGL